jgi:hypothetical protein
MKNKMIGFWTLFLTFLFVLILRPALGIEVGVLGGPTISRLSSPDLSWKYRLSYSIGAFANFRLNRFLQWQPELRLTTVRSGATIQIKFSIFGQDVELAKTVRYVELPMTLRFVPFNRGKVQPNIQLGSYAAVMVDGKDYLESKGQSHTEDIDDELKKFHAGFLAGLGIDFYFGRVAMHLSGLWRLGLNPVAANYLQQDIKSSGFVVNLGVGFRNPGVRSR